MPFMTQVAIEFWPSMQWSLFEHYWLFMASKTATSNGSIMPRQAMKLNQHMISPSGIDHRIPKRYEPVLPTPPREELDESKH